MLAPGYGLAQVLRVLLNGLMALCGAAASLYLPQPVRYEQRSNAVAVIAVVEIILILVLKLLALTNVLKSLNPLFQGSHVFVLLIQYCIL